jgi:hypothetical protein
LILCSPRLSHLRSVRVQEQQQQLELELQLFSVLAVLQAHHQAAVHPWHQPMDNRLP